MIWLITFHRVGREFSRDDTQADRVSFMQTPHPRSEPSHNGLLEAVKMQERLIEL